MTPAAEYGFVSSGQFIGWSTQTSSPHLLTVARTLAPTFALNGLGYNARAFSLFTGADDLGQVRSTKALVFADVGSGTQAAYRKMLDGYHGRVFYDLFEVPADGTASRAFCAERSTILTAASEHVAQATATLLGRPVHLVPEPFDGLHDAPRAPQVPPRSRAVRWLAQRAGLETTGWRLRLFWSGEESDLGSIVAAYPQLVRAGGHVPLALHCIAPQGPALERMSDTLCEDDPEAVQLRLEAWSPLTVAQGLLASDFVLLPDAGPASRSRLISALRAGRFAIARPSPYHGKLAAFAWVGDDLAEGIRWALAHAEDVLARLGAGQRYVQEMHEPAAVARAWIELFMKSGQ
jgi:hypothetical protein